MIQKISKTYTAADRETYVTIPFTLSENTESFTVKYDYDRSKSRLKDGVTDENCVDIALLDPCGNLVGASGSNKKDFFISAKWSTPGYHATTPVAGVWNILLGLYRVKNNGVAVDITVETEEKHFRWLKGDAHTHTYHSDGKLSVERLASYAKKRGLDWLILTDHNVHHREDMLKSDRNFLMMKGMELTCYNGHLNLFGADKPISGSYAFKTDEELSSILDEARENGAIVSINHPTCKKCGWHISLDFPFDCMEVWNGPMRIDNVTGIALWHKFLTEGRRIAAVGGSDFHRDYVVTKLLGVPTTVVRAKSNSQDDVLKALVKGASYITSGPRGTSLILTSGEATLGDETEWTEKSEVTLTASHVKRGHRVVVYNNDQIISDETAPSTGAYKKTLKVPNKGFVRAEITYKYGVLGTFIFHLGMKLLLPQDAKAKLPPFVKALTNPIFFV